MIARSAVEKTIPAMGRGKLKSFGEKRFPNLDDSSQEGYLKFAEENAGSLFDQAATQEGVYAVFCCKAPLQQRGLRIMGQVVDLI